MPLGQRPRIRRRRGWGGLGGDPRHETPYPQSASPPRGRLRTILIFASSRLRRSQAPTMALTASTARVPSTAAGTLAVLALKMPGVGVSEGGVFSSGSVNIDRRRPLNERARAHGEAPCPQGGIGHHRALHDAGLPRRGEADGLLHRKRPPGGPLCGGRVLLDARHGCRRLRPPKSRPKAFRQLRQTLKWAVTQSLASKSPCDSRRPPKRVKTPTASRP